MEVKTINGYDIKDETARNKLLTKLNYYIIELSDSQEKIQNILSDTNSKIIEFTKGTYNFDNTFRLNKNTKLILNDSILNFTTPHAFYNFRGDDEFLKYDGNSNIEIIGGTINGGTIRFCHAKNIVIKNIKFNNSLAGHVLEMCSINGLYVENCEFNGGITDEVNGETIQIDEMLYNSFPWFDSENNPTYDGTPNTNWLINHCKFTLNTDNQDLSFHTGIGGHYSQVGERHTNITISNNIFSNFDFAGVRLRQVDNVIVENNKFYHGINETRNINTIELQQTCNNVVITNNYVDGNDESTSCFIYGNTDTNNLVISNNKVYNMFTQEGLSIDNDCVIFLYGLNPIIENNIFENFEKEFMKIQASTEKVNNVIVKNNIFSKSEFNGYLVRFATKGTYQFINNEVDIKTLSNVIRLNSYVDKLIAKGNRINNEITEVISANGYLGDYQDVYDIMITAYSGNTVSLTNQILNVDYNNFNTLILTCGVAGSNMNQYQLKAFNPSGKLGASTYYLPAISSSNDGKINFQTNSDGTVNYTTTNSDIVFRSIRLKNE